MTRNTGQKKKAARKRSASKKAGATAKRIKALGTSVVAPVLDVSQRTAKPVPVDKRIRKAGAKKLAGYAGPAKTNQASFVDSAPHTIGELQAAKGDWSARLMPRDNSPKGRPSTLSAVDYTNENVTGVGIAEKLVQGKPTGVMAVKFFVHRKHPASRISRKNLLPKHINGLPVDVEEVEFFRALRAPARGIANPRGRLVPAQPGCSIGFRVPGSSSGDVGTFGALVRDSVGVYILSNNHVLSFDNTAGSLNTPIFQPAPFERDPRSQPIAVLENLLFLDPSICNQLDAAIARVPDPRQVSNSILQIGPARGVGVAQLNMQVHKFGRTTEYTSGIVRSVDFDIRVAFRRGVVLTFCDQIVVEGDRGSRFADDGDSGALVLERNSQFAVGLVMGVGIGRDGNSYVVANHLSPILNRLNLQLL